jgi:hypothetical protein
MGTVRIERCTHCQAMVGEGLMYGHLLVCRSLPGVARSGEVKSDEKDDCDLSKMSPPLADPALPREPQDRVDVSSVRNIASQLDAMVFPFSAAMLNRAADEIELSRAQLSAAPAQQEPRDFRQLFSRPQLKSMWLSAGLQAMKDDEEREFHEVFADDLLQQVAQLTAVSSVLPRESVCVCGHVESNHPFGLSENLMLPGRCQGCSCEQFQAVSSVLRVSEMTTEETKDTNS